MEMPKPTEQHAMLARLSGNWSGEETLYPSAWAPEQRTATGRFENRIGVGGMYLVNEYVQERAGEVIFWGHGVYGYDSSRERFTMFWFDSMGFSPSETLGTWENDTLTFANQSPQAHNRYIYRLHGVDGMEFRIETSADGSEWKTLMEGHYTRDGA